MIKSLSLKLDLSEKTHAQLEELELKNLNKMQLKREKKQIISNMKKELKRINKECPFKKEIQKLMEEDK